jgi:AraC-like DNA-binding protein
MKTLFLPSPSTIAPYVSGIMVIETSEKQKKFFLPLYVNGFSTLVFQTEKGTRAGSTIDHLGLYGHLLQPSQLSFDKPVTVIAYFLNPYSAYALFGVSLKELTDGYIDLNYLQQAKNAGLQEKLLDTESLHQRLELINDFVLYLSRQQKENNPRVILAANCLRQNTEADALRILQKELKISERSLQRFFEEHVGISPKLYKRVCQFNAAFQQLNSHGYSRLSDIAYDHSFADQSHFNRVFKEFTGLTPKEYLVQSAPYNPRF